MGYKGASRTVETETLAQVIERHRSRVWALEVDAGLRKASSRRVSNRTLSERSGIHWGTVEDWINTGHVGSPELLADFAEALVHPQSPHDPTYPTADPILAELQAAAGLPVGAGITWDLPADYLLLSQRKRTALNQLIRAWVSDDLALYGKTRTHNRIVRDTSSATGGDANGGDGPAEGTEPGDAQGSP